MTIYKSGTYKYLETLFFSESIESEVKYER